MRRKYRVMVVRDRDASADAEVYALAGSLFEANEARAELRNVSEVWIETYAGDPHGWIVVIRA